MAPNKSQAKSNAKKHRKPAHHDKPMGQARKKPVHTPPAKPTFGSWVSAARPRTLPVALAPVIAGTGAAATVDGLFHWALGLACAAVALCLQIGVNFTNDYSDGIRGTDAHRAAATGQAPTRLTASGAVPAKRVLGVGLSFFALAALAGLVITARTGHWWFIAVGLACLAAAWFYTGGKRPYGYAGLGEVFVFVFFGLVATLGTTYVEVGMLPQTAWLAAVGVGCFAVAVLLANNLRDMGTDKLAGKRTLSTFIGRRGTQILFTVVVLVPFAIIAFVALLWPIAWLGMLVGLLIFPTLFIVWMYKEPRELIPVLALVSLADLAWALVLFWAWLA